MSTWESGSSSCWDMSTQLADADGQWDQHVLACHPVEHLLQLPRAQHVYSGWSEPCSRVKLCHRTEIKCELWICWYYNLLGTLKVILSVLVGEKIFKRIFMVESIAAVLFFLPNDLFLPPSPNWGKRFWKNRPRKWNELIQLTELQGEKQKL